MRKFLLLIISVATGITTCLASLVNGSQGRGLVALPTQSGNGVFISWRLLPTDDKNTTFEVIRDGQVIATDVKRATSYTDMAGTTSSTYSVVVKQNGMESETTAAVTPWRQIYKTLKVDRPAEAKTTAGQSYSYKPGDCAIADADGDGEYELLLKWRPSNHKDNGESGQTGIVYLDCYKFNGTKLWRVNLGKNIRSGEHYTQIIFYDLNGDGKAEMVCKTAPGSKDGTGNYVTDAATDAAIKALDNSEDLRNKSNGLILKGAELLTVFEGATGKAVHTVWYSPNRAGALSGVGDYPADDFWGDNFANRSERYLAAVAYLDGTAANKTRQRAGVGEFAAGMDNATFWTRYQKERMVELAFEGHRFWDVRRWKEADKFLKSITEMKLTRGDDGTINYARNTVSRQWDDKMYLFPIPQTELMKNPNLTQNPGW